MSSPIKRRFILIVILALAALADYLYLGLARRTFVFYTVDGGVIVVEDRMLKHTPAAGSNVHEDDIIRYTEETLLGPVSPDLLPLFPRETRLKSLLYRNGAVYVNLSQSASLPPVEGGAALDNFMTFHAGILRNFSYVEDVYFFIDGEAAFPGEFSGRHEIRDDTAAEPTIVENL
ncbi:MAG: GerMN domain-containing protein [Treponema sp.]|nr:GerMN domain-containing protein [Treponema sp.]